MVKKSGKSFKSGLDMLIQKTTVSEEPEISVELKEVKPTVTEKESATEKEKEKQITITIPISLKRDIKKYCVNNEITIKDLFINSVNKYMNLH
jgi:hypothetical protein